MWADREAASLRKSGVGNVFVKVRITFEFEAENRKYCQVWKDVCCTAPVDVADGQGLWGAGTDGEYRFSHVA